MPFPLAAERNPLCSSCLLLLAHLTHHLDLVHSAPAPSLGFGPQRTCPITRMWPTGSVCCFSVPVLELFKVAKTNHPNHFSRVRSADHRDPGGWLSGPTILMLGFPAPWSRGHVGDSPLSRSSGTVTEGLIQVMSLPGGSPSPPLKHSVFLGRSQQLALSHHWANGHQ